MNNLKAIALLIAKARIALASGNLAVGQTLLDEAAALIPDNDWPLEEHLASAELN